MPAGGATLAHAVCGECGEWKVRASWPLKQELFQNSFWEDRRKERFLTGASLIEMECAHIFEERNFHDT